MRNLSVAMTAIVRTQGGEGDISYEEGTMLATTRCVDVRWQYLAFTVTIIVLAGSFLLLIARENRDTPASRLWKSSVLETLFCEVEHDRVNEAKTIYMAVMIHMARPTSVSVEGSKGTLKLVAHGEVSEEVQYIFRFTL
jgi:hypothetical protein